MNPDIGGTCFSFVDFSIVSKTGLFSPGDGIKDPVRSDLFFRRHANRPAGGIGAFFGKLCMSTCRSGHVSWPICNGPREAF